MTIQLLWWRDDLRAGMHVCIIDHGRNQYVEGLFTDEMAYRSSHQGAKQEFMDSLCNKWHELFGERIVAVQVEGAEWIVRYKDDGVQVSGKEEIRQGSPVDRVQATETTRDVVRDPSD